MVKKSGMAFGTLFGSMILACYAAAADEPILRAAGGQIIQLPPSKVAVVIKANTLDPVPCQLVLEAAIRAFKQNDFDLALVEVTKGLERCSVDRDLHEFRALVLFAKGDFKESSASLHRALNSGSHWNWATMCRIYSDVGLYTKHLRTLEAYTRKHPDDGAARFLQAYHYMVDGYPDAAIRELQMVIRLESDDAIAANLLKIIPTVPGLAIQASPQKPTTLSGSK